MKLHLRGSKLVKFHNYSNIYFDNFISEDTFDLPSFKSFIKNRLKYYKYRRLDKSCCYLLIMKDNGDLELAQIHSMKNNMILAKVYGVNEVEFLHLYLLHSTGTGKMMFPAGCANDVKGIYR